MTYKTSLAARIMADPVVRAAGATVDWSKRPQGSAYPAIVLTIVYEPHHRTMTGRHGWIPVHLFIDVMALSAPTLEALKEAVLALIGFGEKIEDIRFWPAHDVSVADLSEQTDTQFVHRDQIDAVIPYRTET